MSLKNLVNKFKGKKILVVGDLMLDIFLNGEVTRVSPEAPVPIVDIKSEFKTMGGAANVAHNIKMLEGEVYLAGLVGDDEKGKTLMSLIKKEGINTSAVVIEKKRRTTQKIRIIGQSQQMMRVDKEDTHDVDGKEKETLSERIALLVPKVDVIVISDYAKGVVSIPVIETVFETAKREGKKVLVDPKRENFLDYAGATIIVPNEKEAEIASRVKIIDDVSLLRAGRTLLKEEGSEAILITRGADGMSLFENDAETHIPTLARDVFDVTGAGDTVISVLALALASGAKYKDSARLANVAAGVVVGKIGTVPVRKDEILDWLEEVEEEISNYEK